MSYPSTLYKKLRCTNCNDYKYEEEFAWIWWADIDIMGQSRCIECDKELMDRIMKEIKDGT